MPYRNIEIIKNESVYERNGVYYLNEPDETSLETENIYLEMRAKEGRIYSDEQVKLLPEIESTHKYFSEWNIRAYSSENLCSLIHSDRTPKSVLEIGCGNGWLTSRLSEDPDSWVIGLDINRKELEQAARVFRDRKNLVFAYGNIFEHKFSRLKLDYIILASSLSYFKDPHKLIAHLHLLLNEMGEIHLIDNPSYNDMELPGGGLRTKKYFEQLGFPGRSAHYFHHNLIEIVKKYRYEILYDPKTTTNRAKKYLGKPVSPFYWIKISA